MNTFFKGARVKCSFEFKDTLGSYIDPTAVLFSFLTPAGVSTIYTYGVGADVVRSALGKYHSFVNADEVGMYYIRGYSTGTGKAAVEDSFRVIESHF